MSNDPLSAWQDRHRRLAELTAAPDARVPDLGCGEGATLQELTGGVGPGGGVPGSDRNARALTVAASAMPPDAPRWLLLCGDLAQPLPIGSGASRAGWAGSTMTATRRGPPETREAPWSTIQVPERDSTRETATSPGWSGCSAVRSALPATASTADGSRPAAGSPSGSSPSQRSTPGVADSTSPVWESTTKPGASGPSGSVASPTSSARGARSARAAAP